MSDVQKLAKRMYDEGWRTQADGYISRDYNHSCCDWMTPSHHVYNAMRELENPHLAEARQLFDEGWRIGPSTWCILARGERYLNVPAKLHKAVADLEDAT